MRLIDAVHLKSMLQEYIKREQAYIDIGNNPSIAIGHSNGLWEAIAQINEEPTIEQQPEIMQRWIPVSEALPDRYIVGGDGKHYSQDVLMTVIHRDDDIFIDYGQMVDDEWYSEMDKEIITSPFEVVAWMHIPKPYRGGQDETRGVSETT